MVMAQQLEALMSNQQLASTHEVRPSLLPRLCTTLCLSYGPMLCPPSGPLGRNTQEIWTFGQSSLLVTSEGDMRSYTLSNHVSHGFTASAGSSCFYWTAQNLLEHAY